MRPFGVSGCALAALVASACGPRGSPDSGAACIPGVWESPPLTCRTVCPGRPQCGAADCSLRDLLVLLEGGDGLSVRVSVSFVAKSLTGGPRTTTVWSVAGDELILGSSSPQKWTCDSSSLSVGLQTLARSDVALTRAVLGANQSSEWENVALE